MEAEPKDLPAKQVGSLMTQKVGSLLVKKQKPKGWPGMVYVDGGTFTMGLVKDDVMHDWNNTPRRMQVSAFFIGETEITNYEYRE